MKISYVLNGYFPENVGGSEVYTHALARFMQREGHEVTIIVPCYNYREKLDYNYEGVSVKRYYESSTNSKKLILGLEKPNGLNNYTELIKKIDPDIVHFQMISTSACITVFHLEITKKMNYKTILTIHMSHYTCLTENLLLNNKSLCDGKIESIRCGKCYLINKNIPAPLSLPISIFSWILKLLPWKKLAYIPLVSVSNHVKTKTERLKKIEKNTDLIIAITEWYKKALILNKIDSNKIKLIKQGFIGDSDILKKEIINLSNLKLIFIGRICKVKGVHLLLKALIGIERFKYQLDIYGPFDNNDPYFNECSDIIENNNLNVFFKGIIDRTNIVNTIKGYHYLCLPSIISEMSPLVIQEAFAAGRPVIGSNVFGIAEEIKNGFNGYLFPFANIVELQKIFKQLIKNPENWKFMADNIKPPMLFEDVGKQNLIVYKAL